VVRGLDWTEGDLMEEAVKLVWNSCVVVNKDTGGTGSLETGWGKALVWLYNLPQEGQEGGQVAHGWEVGGCLG
jgi:hypothetical protein